MRSIRFIRDLHNRQPREALSDEEAQEICLGLFAPGGVGLQMDQTGNRARALDHGNRLMLPITMALMCSQRGITHG